MCVDRSFCDASDASCCDSRGGRLSCPDSAPLMCQNLECATDCAAHGGLRPCSGPELPAKPPPLLEASSPSHTSLFLRWRQGSYLSGATGGCVFFEWITTISQDNVTWTSVPSCSSRDLEETSCVIGGLASNQRYKVRLVEGCLLSGFNSRWREVDIWTVPERPETPANFTINTRDPSLTSVSFSWDEGNWRGDCVFAAWRVERRVLGASAWTTVADCAGVDAQDTTCDITGLSADELNELQVTETCTDPVANSPTARVPPFRSLEAKVWDVLVDPSATALVDVNVLDSPTLCYATADWITASTQYSLCHSGSGNRLATLVRTDTPGGWGEPLRLRCSSEANAWTSVQAIYIYIYIYIYT